MELTDLREHIQWHTEYRPEWDGSPDEYVERGVVARGKTRRLGMYRHGAVKAYLGVQHVDPGRVGWAIMEEAQARFFVSLFAHGRVVTLRTFATMGETLESLRQFVERVGEG